MPMSRILTLFLLFAACFSQISAQPTPVPTQTSPKTTEKKLSPLMQKLGLIDIQGFTSPEDVVKEWIIGGDCFDVSNITFKGSPVQFGHFTDGQVFGMDQGAILCTGLVENGIGPNDEDLATFNLGGKLQDIDLVALSFSGGLVGGGGVGGPPIPETFDLCTVEFDFTPTVTPITFQYVFASEEYCERNFDQFDDRFGFFVKGPGIVGSYSGYANMAQIAPVVFPISYVGVATLNNVDNANIFRNNQPPFVPNPTSPPPAGLCGAGTTALSVQAIEYDGFSATLSTIPMNVVPCQTYRVKIKIADVGDGNGDSAVFIKAAGFSSGNKGKITTAVDGDPDNNIAIETCDVGEFVFERVSQSSINTPVTVNYAISGSATAGVDYQPIPLVTTIPAGQLSVTVPLNILPDGILEGDENVRLTVTNPCSCVQPFQEIIIRDYTAMSIQADPVENCGPGPVFLEPFLFDGDEPYTYKWSNGSTDPFISPFTAASTTYKVTVTDDCGKTIVASFPVKIRTLPKATTGGTATLCRTGSAKVSIPVVLTGEGPWSITYTHNSAPETVSGITTSPYSLDVTEAGIYKLTEVSDGGDCPGTAAGTYVVIADEVNLSGIANNVECFGFNNGSINTTAKDGVEPYSYAWTPNLGNVADPQNLAPGLYKLIVTDQKGCTNKDSFNIIQPPIINLAALEITEADCKNPAGGTAAVSASGGVGNFTYLWNNGQTSATATGLSAGSYTVVATDQTGCTKSLTVNVPGDFNLPSASAFANGSVTCGNQNVALLGGGSSIGGQFSYLWTGGSFSGPIDQINATAIAPGNYTLIVTNTQNGCTATASATVTGNVILPAAAASVLGEINCVSAQVNISGNGSSTGGNFTYQWSGPGLVGSPNSLNLQANQPGFYQILVTNTATGCINTADVNVVGNFAQPTATAVSPQNLNCKFPQVQLDGTAGPTGGMFTYNWSTTGGQIVANGNTPNPTVGLPGTYNLLVTNVQNGCTAATSVIVAQTSPPVASISAAQNVLCFGGNSGSATAAATLGTGSYTYLWNDGQTTSTAQNLPAGPINVVVTDTDGCTSTASSSLTQPTALTVTTSSTGQSIVGANDGTASASSVGGTSGYSFVWSNGQSGSTISNLEPGSYSVTSTDANGCTAVGSTVVAVAPCQLSMSATIENAKCNGFADGSISVDLMNETGDADFVWSNMGTGAQLTGLTAGQYFVTATDDNGCTLVQGYMVDQPTAILITETHQDVACAGDTNGSATITVSGGTPNYMYNWSTGSTQPFETNLGPGTYSVGVNDANGCLTAFFVEIEAVDNVPPQLVLQTPTVAIDDNGKATLLATDFDNGSVDNCGIVSWDVTPLFFDCSNLGLQSVTLTVTDGAGNTTVQTAQANIIDNKKPILLCPANKETWSCTPTVSYAFPVATDNCLGNGGQFNLESGLSSGVQYPLGVTENVWTYTDAGGNIGTCSFTVTVHALPTVTGLQQLPLCFGDCNGALTAEPAGGKGPFTYVWDNGQTTAQATGLCKGNHVVTVTDGGGCVSIHTLFLAEPSQLNLTVGTVTNDIGDAGIGAISVTVNGGTPGLTYEWTKGGVFFSNNQNLTGLKTGTYVLKVTDANGCVVSTQNVFVDNLVSANEPEWATGMTLSPNPTSGLAEIVFKSNPPKKAQVDIFDVNGRLIESLLFEKQQPVLGLDLSAQPAGVYQLRINIDGGTVSRQLVKQ